ncbi:Sulfotransferase domain protein [Rubripirellula obstinata]|uniref:Sulfotransferase domain protein n=2 Tax=Rubripirellula obstinata TaxID=406547 RepID=A0A5B1CKX4_9BACT|nr:Sulfotransferase domain protein [Rubripirellula obstinata]
MTHSYLELAMRCATRVHFVSYEDMLSEPEQNLAHCFSWLGETVDAQIIAEAVERNRFERAQKNESSRQTDPNHNFFRRGTSGAGQDELSQKTLDRIHAETSELMKQARSRIASKSRFASVGQSSAA